MTFEEVMNLWVQAGGSPQSAAMAAAVADASSGLNPDATFTQQDGTIRRGLWQIPSTLQALSTTDPMGNARAAVQLSNYGQDFSKWCSAWSDNNCGQSGGEYLGDGSNALASLNARGGSYEVIGGQGQTSALPTGTAAPNQDPNSQAATDSANPQQTITNAQPQPTSTATPSRLPLILMLAALAFVLWYAMRKSKGKAETSEE